jgi:hypothetical protein
MLFFLTAASLLKKLPAGRDAHNETLLGAVLAFFFILSFLFSIMMILECFRCKKAGFAQETRFLAL